MYGYLPSSVQHLVCSLEGYRLQRVRFGRDFDVVLREAEERSEKSAADIVALRDGLFRQFVSDAARASAFYGRQASFQSAARFRPFRSEDLPILDKPTVQARAADIAPPTERAAEIVATSGSTGTGLRFPVTNHAVQQQWATWWRFRRWHGIRRDEWCGYFGGRPVVPVEG